MTLSLPELDALTEVVNIGVGRAAEALNTLVDRHVELAVPRLEVIAREEFDVGRIWGRGGRGDGDEPVAVVQEFAGGPSGRVALVFPTASAATLVSALIGAPLGAPELDTVRIGTLVEVGNIVINALVGSISNLIHAEVTFGLPEFYDYGMEALVRSGPPGSGVVIVAEIRFRIEGLEIDGHLVIVVEVESIDHILSGLDVGRRG